MYKGIPFTQSCFAHNGSQIGLIKRTSVWKVICRGLIVLFVGLLGVPPSSSIAQQADRNRGIETAIARAKDALLAHQRADGAWAGDIVISSRYVAYYVIVSHYVNHIEHPYYYRALTWLIEHQNSDGTWGQMATVAKPASISNTAAAALALEVAGIAPDDSRLVRAREYIVHHGGIDVVDPLVQTMYALYDRSDWDGPGLSQFDLRFLMTKGEPVASVQPWPPWWREAFVPLATLRTLNRGDTLSLDERKGLRMAEEWLLTHQLSDGAWFTAFPTLFAVMALHDLDRARYQQQIKNGFQFLHSRQMPTGIIRPFELSVWDTSIALLALRSAGTPACDPIFQPSLRWLTAAQSPGGLGLSESVPGGWSYNQHNLIYPDNDDTGLALLSMSRLLGQSSHVEYNRQKAIQDAKEWLLYMQGTDGGWATFLRDESKENDAELPTGIQDTSIPDVTGHVLSALGSVGYTATEPRIASALEYLQRSQSEQGSWYGRWGLSYLYGTAAVIVGLRDVGADMDAPFIQEAIDWLLGQQNQDGGWGEAFSAWDQARGISYTVRSDSTAEQTAWVIMALLAAGHGASDAVVRGVDYLLSTQTSTGNWPVGKYTVLGIDAYTNSLYSLHWPLMALGQFQSIVYPGVTQTSDPCAEYKSAYQALTTPDQSAYGLGAPAQLSVGITDSAKGRQLWVENVDTYAIRNLQLTLSPNPDLSVPSQSWSSSELPPGVRSTWPVTISATASESWQLHLSYEDPAGQIRELERNIPIQGKVADTDRTVTLVNYIWVFVLLSGGLVLAAISNWYRPLLSLGYRNLNQHRLRTILTSIGVVLGTAAIGATLTLTLAFRSRLVQDFTTFGANRLIVLPYQLDLQFGPPTDSLRVQPETHFAEVDVQAIATLPDIAEISPYVQEDLSIEFAGQLRKLTVRFVEPETYLNVSPAAVAQGKFLDATDPVKLVLGYAVAQAAFDKPIGLDDQLQVDRKTFNVAGIMSEVGGVRGRIETIVSPDILVYMDIAHAVEFTGRDHFDGLEIRTSSPTTVESVEKEVRALIAQRHPSTEFDVATSQQLRKQVEELLAQFTAIVVVISGLTLLVSGIGVANMMLITIRERMDEIGMMKALGATDHTVMVIFLSEAAMLGLFSAVVGSGIGYLILFVLQKIADVNVLPVAPYLIIFSVAFSLLITLGFGSYPAYVSAKLEPTEAIRRA